MDGAVESYKALKAADAAAGSTAVLAQIIQARSAAQNSNICPVEGVSRERMLQSISQPVCTGHLCFDSWFGLSGVSLNTLE